MSHAMSPEQDGASVVRVYRLAAEAAPDSNALLRLLEPFVIHDVLPHRVDCAADGDALSIELEFSANADLATRLLMRLSTMVCVRDAALVAVERVVPALDAAA